MIDSLNPMKSFFVIITGLSLSLVSSFGAGADTEFVTLYNAIQEAERLSLGGTEAAALQKYREAYSRLQAFKKRYPAFNAKIIAYRERQLRTAIQKFGQPRANKPVTAGASAPSAPNSLGALRAEVQSLKTSNQSLTQEVGVLENKLQEALSNQTRAADLAALRQAEGELALLRKEVEVLRVALEDEQRKVVRRSEGQIVEVPNPNEGAIEAQKALEAAQKALEDARLRLAEKELETNGLKADLASANRALEEKEQQISRLQSELETLRSQPNSSEAERLRIQAELTQAQRTIAVKETEIAQLKNDVVEARQEAGKGAEQSAALESLRSSLASKEREIVLLQQENENLRQTGQLTAGGDMAALEVEIKDLREKLNAANARAYDNETQIKLSKIEQLTNQVAILRTRLQVYEAKKEPFTEEELALMKAPEGGADSAIDREASVSSVGTQEKNGKSGLSSLPPGAGPLVKAAQVAFNSQRYDDAERLYNQALGLDSENVYTLANLALIQMEMGKQAEAEANLKKALQLDSEDAYSLSLLGIMKFRASDFDDALDYLSAAVKRDPDNAETQNYLGIVLSQKGQREPAEAALRKAVSINPDYGSAHYNLAIIYSSQKPPFIELARWHYNKAVAVGHPSNSELEAYFEKVDRAD